MKGKNGNDSKNQRKEQRQNTDDLGKAAIDPAWCVPRRSEMKCQKSVANEGNRPGAQTFTPSLQAYKFKDRQKEPLKRGNTQWAQLLRPRLCELLIGNPIR